MDAVVEHMKFETEILNTGGGIRIVSRLKSPWDGRWTYTVLNYWVNSGVKKPKIEQQLIVAVTLREKSEFKSTDSLMDTVFNARHEYWSIILSSGVVNLTSQIAPFCSFIEFNSMIIPSWANFVHVSANTSVSKKFAVNPFTTITKLHFCHQIELRIPEVDIYGSYVAEYDENLRIRYKKTDRMLYRNEFDVVTTTDGEKAFRVCLNDVGYVVQGLQRKVNNVKYRPTPSSSRRLMSPCVVLVLMLLLFLCW